MLAALIIEALIIGGLLAFLYLRDRDLSRSFERERTQWFEERQILLNRIKPETAQYVAVTAPESPPAVSEFDDDEWIKAKQEELERLTTVG
jgi:hypothetical protein